MHSRPNIQTKGKIIMKNQFVTYKIAKKLKELGFNKPCISEFTIMKNDIRLHLNNHFNTNEKTEPNLPAPLWQQAVEWLRTEHGIEVSILPYQDKDFEEVEQVLYENKIVETRNGWNDFSDYTFHHTPQEALEGAFQCIFEQIVS